MLVVQISKFRSATVIIKCICLEQVIFAINMDTMSSSKVFNIFYFLFLSIVVLRINKLNCLKYIYIYIYIYIIFYETSCILYTLRLGTYFVNILLNLLFTLLQKLKIYSI